MLEDLKTYVYTNAVPLAASAIGGLILGGVHVYCARRINKMSDNYLSELEEEYRIFLEPEKEATAK